MKILWNVVGVLAFILGACGLFLPVLPTTPLWLLAAYCLLRGSHSLYERAMSVRLFNSIVTTYQVYRAIPLHAKIIAISTLWATIILSCIIVGKWWLITLLLLIATGVTWHILSYRTLSKEEWEQLKKEVEKRRNQ